MAGLSIRPTDRVFVLTGAGISAESGMPTFRADDGLWAGIALKMYARRKPGAQSGTGVDTFTRSAASMAQRLSPILRILRWPNLNCELATVSFCALKTWTICMNARVRCGCCICTVSLPNRAANTSAVGRRWKIMPYMTVSTKSLIAPVVEGCALTLFSSAKCRWGWSGFSVRFGKATLMLVIGTSGVGLPGGEFCSLGAQSGARRYISVPSRH